MYSRVKKVFVGTDISRTSSVVVFSYLNGGSSTQTAAAGEIVVLDKNRNVMSAGTTYADSDKIFIAEVTSTALAYANEAGTAITPYKVLLSDPIDGAYIRSYSGQSYTARTQRTATMGYINQTITTGDEYVLRIIYKDVKEHPGQKTQSYRVLATDATVATMAAALNTLINADPNGRVTSAVGSSGATSYLTLTGRAIPECTTALTDIDEFRMVDFEVFFYWIDQTASTYKGLGPFNKVTMSAATTYAGPIYPKGSWEIVRDAEKAALGQQMGVTNRIWFPVRQPSFRAVLAETYDSIIIEYDVKYRSPDTGYDKMCREAVKIFIPNPASGLNQSTDVLAVLNPWMASTPGAFGAVSV
jgi:hypothetical protein